MNRLTQKTHINSYTVALNEIEILNELVSGAAIQRLALYENIRENTENEQQELSQQMETLRAEGKKSSVKFKELMIKKLNNATILSTFKAYGL